MHLAGADWQSEHGDIGTGMDRFDARASNDEVYLRVRLTVSVWHRSTQCGCAISKPLPHRVDPCLIPNKWFARAGFAGQIVSFACMDRMQQRHRGIGEETAIARIQIAFRRQPSSQQDIMGVQFDMMVVNTIAFRVNADRCAIDQLSGRDEETTDKNRVFR